ncbi:MAG: PAS domain S-box protein [Planctomycetota bacterium]|nr:MAG: PAS domain S-box protein [Planctomycetota bacterium]
MPEPRVCGSPRRSRDSWGVHRHLFPVRLHRTFPLWRTPLALTYLWIARKRLGGASEARVDRAERVGRGGRPASDAGKGGSAPTTWRAARTDGEARPPASPAAAEADRGAIERRLVARLAAGERLERWLEEFCRAYEAIHPDSFATVLLLRGGVFRVAAAPSLPETARQALDGLRPAPGLGSCAAAALSGQPVFATDVCTRASWEKLRPLALALGVRSCWSFPIRDETGAVVGILASSHTTVRRPGRTEQQELEHWARLCALAIERDQRQAEIREHAELLHDLFESTSDLIQSVDERGRFLFVNRAWRETLGYEEHEIARLSVFDVIAPEHRNSCGRIFERLCNGELQQTLAETVFVARDGRRVWLEGNVSASREAGRLVWTRGIFRDVTERREALEKLRASEERFRRLIENASDLITVFCPRGRIVYQSPSSERILGLSPVDLAGRSLWEYVHPEDHEPLRAAVHTALEAVEQPVDVSFRFRDAKGAWRFLSARLRRYSEAASEREVSLLCNARDDTERRRLEAQLRRAQKMEAIGRLAGGIAHDFNNVLTVIQGCSSLLLESIPDEGGPPQLLEEIRRAVDRASDLVRQLLLFGRQQAMRPRRVSLGDVVTRLARMLTRIVGEDIELRLSLPEQDVVIHADPSMVEQVVMNLVVNARDALPDGGEVEIGCERVELEEADAREIEVRAGVHGRLWVRDTGSGMPPEVLERIFEPFFTTKEVGKGTGLGLSTVYGIVRQHGGGIEVESRPGQGTLFRVYFPSADGVSSSGSPVAERRPAPRGSGERILLVEDEEAVRRLVATMLERRGYTVLTAESGPDALRIWRERGGAIDLVMTDLVMAGGMSGVELAEALRRERPDLAIVFTSGYGESARAGEIELVPGRNFVPKPSRMPVLLETIRHALEAARRDG